MNERANRTKKTILAVTTLAAIALAAFTPTAEAHSEAYTIMYTYHAWFNPSNNDIYLNVTASVGGYGGLGPPSEISGGLTAMRATYTLVPGPGNPGTSTFNADMTRIGTTGSKYYHNQSISIIGTSAPYAGVAVGMFAQWTEGGLNLHEHTTHFYVSSNELLQGTPFFITTGSSVPTTSGPVSNLHAYEGQAHANATWCPIANCVTTVDGEAFVTNNWANSTDGFERKTRAEWGRDYANQTYEGQQHANATWCPLNGCGGGGMSRAEADAVYESQWHANETWCPRANALCAGNFTGNFTTMGGETLGAAIPAEMAVPGYIIFVALAGVGIAFISKTNPMPSMAGFIVELVALALWYAQPSDTYVIGGTDLKAAYGLLIIMCALGLAARTFLMMGSRQNADGNMG